MMRRTFMMTMICVSLARASAGQPPSAAPLGASAYLDAAGGLTLDAAIETALAKEPGIRAVRTGLDTANGRREQAGLRPNPSVTFAQQVQPGGTDAQTRIEAQWPLDLYRRKGRLLVAESAIASTQAGISARERELKGLVRQKYGDVSMAIRNLSVNEQLVAASRAQLDLIAARVDDGAAPAIERTLVEAETQQLLAEQIGLAGRVERELLELKRLTGLAPDATVKLRSSLDDLVRQDTAPLLPGSPDARADVVEARARVAISEAEVSRAKADAKPDVSLFGMYMRMDAGFPQQGFGISGALEPVRGVFHYVSAGAMVSVPMFNRNQGEIAAIRAEGAAAALNLEAAKLRAQNEVAAARVRVEHADAALKAYAQARTLASQNTSVLEQSYGLGRATVIDVLEQRRRYLDVETRYSSALGELYAARQELRQAAGEDR